MPPRIDDSSKKPTSCSFFSLTACAAKPLAALASLCVPRIRCGTHSACASMHIRQVPASHGGLPSMEVCELIYNRILFSVTLAAPAYAAVRTPRVPPCTSGKFRLRTADFLPWKFVSLYIIIFQIPVMPQPAVRRPQAANHTIIQQECKTI